jgi:hypothetical protein
VQSMAQQSGTAYPGIIDLCDSKAETWSYPFFCFELGYFLYSSFHRPVVTLATGPSGYKVTAHDLWVLAFVRKRRESYGEYRSNF